MSRCFQYPPPGYTGNEESHEALIKSIKLRREREEKLQRERKQAKQERKKREKKEKKKEKKEKEKQHIQNKINKDENYLQKVTREDENEQSDRSSLSEEHEQPISIGRTKSSSSSDSTQSSCCKRKRRNVVSSTSGKKEAVVIREDSSRTDPGYKKLLNEALQYEDMINNWIPPPLETEELEFDDQDCWLITKKNSDNQVQKKLKPSNVSNCCGSSYALWPRAQFLPEADIYALPFTVPF